MTRALSAPAPNGQRNQGLGSTPVAARITASAARTSRARPALVNIVIRAW